MVEGRRVWREGGWGGREKTRQKPQGLLGCDLRSCTPCFHSTLLVIGLSLFSIGEDYTRI
jgi:hypothetical protein